jgi:hypothetical protein
MDRQLGLVEGCVDVCASAGAGDPRTDVGLDAITPSLKLNGETAVSLFHVGRWLRKIHGPAVVGGNLDVWRPRVAGPGDPVDLSLQVLR